MKHLLIIAILFSAACVFGNRSEPDVQNPIVETEKQTTSDSTEGECKICEFDYAGYEGPLTKSEIKGLLLALNDEYKAYATYQAINKDFDNPRPFVNIIRSEARHIEKLNELFEKYRLKIPEKNPWIGEAPEFESVKEACQAGIIAEKENVKLYDDLLSSTKRDDVLTVYKNLRRASLKNHKPAFERCVNRKGPGKSRRSWN